MSMVTTEELKLNIGAGVVDIPGFTPIDRKRGTEAYPLPQYADGSVAEIRASHILEHFPFCEVPNVLKEWVRVLKPGGLIRIAVPDIAKIKADDPKAAFYLMGGQTDDNDYHRSAFTEASLRDGMARAGLVDIQAWEDAIKDCASLPISLNLQGTKSIGVASAATPKATITIPGGDKRIAAVASLPRLGWNDAWGVIFEALASRGIPIRRASGAFWGQCIQRLFTDVANENIDWLLAIDYDTLFTSRHLTRLLAWFSGQTKVNNSSRQFPGCDAIAALQAHRGEPRPLMTKQGVTQTEWDGFPIEVDTAHFGLTLISVEALKKVPKPWFKEEPDELGEFGPERIDSDIWFWRQWKAAGNNLFVAPDVRVGHLQVSVREFDEKLQFQTTSVKDWRDRETGAKVKGTV